MVTLLPPKPRMSLGFKFPPSSLQGVLGLGVGVSLLFVQCFLLLRGERRRGGGRS